MTTRARSCKTLIPWLHMKTMIETNQLKGRFAHFVQRTYHKALF